MLEEPINLLSVAAEFGPSEAEMKLEKVLESMAWQCHQLSLLTAICVIGLAYINATQEGAITIFLDALPAGTLTLKVVLNEWYHNFKESDDDEVNLYPVWRVDVKFQARNITRKVFLVDWNWLWLGCFTEKTKVAKDVNEEDKEHKEQNLISFQTSSTHQSNGKFSAPFSFNW